MKYLSKNDISVFAIFLVSLIMISFAICNSSIAYYKTRITVDTVDLKITPYQPVNSLNEKTINTVINSKETVTNGALE